MEKSLDAGLPDTNPLLPGRDFTLGIAITLIVFGVFVMAQNYLILDVWADQQGIEALSGETLSKLAEPNAEQELLALAEDGDTVSKISIGSGLLGILTMAVLLFFWRSRSKVEILGLRGFSVTHFGLFLLGFAAVVAAQQFIADAVGFEIDFMEKVMGSVTDKTLMLLGIGIIAPLFEELWLRGIAYWSIERISNQHVAIGVTSVAFALLHIQYPWPVILSIIPLGIILGYARSVSGSIVLPIILHILNNASSVLFYEHLG